MKELIIDALDKAYHRLYSIAPTYKVKPMTVDISNLTPNELAHVLLEKAVPDDAKFDWNEHIITWTVKEPILDSENLIFIKSNFSQYAWTEIKM